MDDPSIQQTISLDSARWFTIQQQQLLLLLLLAIATNEFSLSHGWRTLDRSAGGAVAAN